MRLLRSVLVGSVVVCSLSASAAEVTRIVSSFEEDDPLGLVLNVGFERMLTRSALFREGTREGTKSPISGYVPQLFYTGMDARMNMDARVGLSREMELRFGVPLVFAKDESWRRSAEAVRLGDGSLLHNCYQSNGSLRDPSCLATGANATPLLGTPESWATYRGGLGNMRFGLTYGVFNQRRDWTKPNWVLAFDYEAPTAKLLEPTLRTARDARGAFGDRNHRYTFSTALSRRFGAADPYLKASYTLPFRGPGWYSNCDRPSPTNMGLPENCGLDAWSREATGIQAPHTGGLLLGTELLLQGEPAKQSGFSLDVSGHLDFVGPGRYYNPLSGLLDKLLLTEDFLKMGGTIGLTAAPADFFRLTAAARVSYHTDHTLTTEGLGKDLNGNGVVEVDANPAEVNPSFDHRVDAPSRRFRAVDMTSFDLRLSMELAF